ncbi:MAG: hypothetical protein ACOVMR_02220, partial [Flavobacteriales bacterium]
SILFVLLENVGVFRCPLCSCFIANIGSPKQILFFVLQDTLMIINLKRKMGRKMTNSFFSPFYFLRNN